MHRIKAVMGRFLRNTAGNIMPLAAVGLVVAAGIVGSAIDIGQAYRAENRLQAACDAAVLAGRRTVTTNGFDTTARTAANSYFATNFTDSVENTTGTTFTPSSSDNGVTVEGAASTTYTTLVMRLFGFNSFTLSVSCTSSMAMGNADVVFVLDTTGSMDDPLDGSTRIAALRTAMNNFYTTVANATSGTTSRIRYGFVPFATTVNVGHLIYNEDPGYLVDSYTYQSRRYESTTSDPSYSSTNTSDWSKYSNTSYNSATACQAALPASGSSYSDYGSSSTSSSTSSGVTTTVVSQAQRKYTYACATSSNSLSYDDSYGGKGAFAFADMAGSSTRSVSNVSDRNFDGLPLQGSFSNANYIVGINGAAYFNAGYKPGGDWDDDDDHDDRDWDHDDDDHDWGHDDDDDWGSGGDGYSSSTKYYIYYKYDYRTKSVTTVSKYVYTPISQDTSTYKTFTSAGAPTGTAGAYVYSIWDGCILERKTVASSSISYSSVTGISPSGAYDIDIDSAPLSYDEDTKWAPMWLDVTYGRMSGGSYTYTDPTNQGYHPSSNNCPAAAQLLTEMDQTTFSAYAKSLTPAGNTYLDIGMIWGGRLSSPTGIFSSNVNATPSNGAEVSRHLIFMTDGAMNTTSSTLSAWGLEYWDRAVTSDGQSSNNTRHALRLRAACDAIKAKGIRIWVIAFTTALTSDLSYCASTDSSFTPSDSDGLNSAFQDIANEVGELRVTS